MAIKIDLDHPIFSLKSKIQEVSQNFLKQHGLNYFQYLRCFANGSMGLLTNFTGLIEHFQYVNREPVVFSSFKEEHEKAHSYWFLWDEELPPEPVRLAREKLNLHNGITLMRRSKDYYDMIAVALPTERNNAASFYMNKLKSFEQFFDAFAQDNKDLIQVMNKHALILPAPYRDVNYQDICLKQGRIEVLGKAGKSYVTQQELAYLRLLIQGAGNKEIAQSLGLSLRTVETYLNRIRQRTGWTSRSGLRDLLATCP